MFKAASRSSAGRFASLVRWLRARARRVEGRAASRLGIGDAGAADILDLLEQLVYTGEVTPDGEYIETTAGSPFDPFTGGSVPEGMAPGEFWESRVHPDDRAIYAGLNRDLLRGEDCEATYRLVGVDGVTRIVRDRARPRPRRGGGMLLRGIISDVTARAEADARLAEASDRFARLLGVVGAHVYMAEVLPEGRIHEFFQGPGVDRLLGEASRDDEMANWDAELDPSVRDEEMAIWDAAVHPSDRVRLDAFNRMLSRRGGCRRRVPPDRRGRHHALGARPGRVPPSPGRQGRDQRHRLRRDRTAPHAHRARGDACRAVARRRGDGRSPVHAAGRGGRRLPRRVPRSSSRRPGRRGVQRGRGGRRPLGSAAASRRPRALALVRRAPRRRAADRAGVPRARARRRRAHRPRPPAPSPRRRRNALLRRRHARHQRASPAGGGAAARAQSGRAESAHRRADRRVQPPPLRRDRRGGARRRPEWLRAAAARRRPLQAGQRRARPRHRRRCARRARAPARGRLGARRRARALGRGGVRRAAARRRLGSRARTPRPAPARRRRAAAGRRRGRQRAAYDLDRRGARRHPARDARRARRSCRSLPLHREAGRPQPGVARARAGGVGRASRASPIPWAWRVRSRSRPASAADRPRPTPSMWPRSLRGRRSTWRCRTGSC